MNTQIIGVSGTNGSGKDALMELLRDKHGYMFISATDLLTAELHNAGLPTDREHKSALSAEWRRKFGVGVIVQKAFEAWQSHEKAYKGLVIGSIRHPGEAEVIHELGGTMVWLDANPRLRYQRIQNNAASRGRAAEDAISFEQFLIEEDREMRPTGDSATLNMLAVKEHCDIFMDNSSEDLDEFRSSIEKVLQLN